MAPANKIFYVEGELVGTCIYLGDSHVKNGRRYAHFKCKCGNEFITTIQKIKSGHTKSCGCDLVSHLISINKTHGMANSVEYITWGAIKQRCSNPNVPCFKRYGKRGIGISKEWFNSFETFFKDMGPKPSPDHSIERIENSKSYSKENCKWATPKEQANNRRSTIKLFYRGETLSVKQWCERLNLPYSAIIQRVNANWDCIEALETPVKKSKCQK